MFAWLKPKRRKAKSKKRRSQSKTAARRYRQFWGVPHEKVTKTGPGRKVFVSLGRAPAITLASGPKARPGKTKRVRLSRAILLTNISGNRFWIWRKKSEIGRPVKFLGYAKQTDYMPSASLEKRGTPKAGAWWQHQNGETGGNWPRVYEDKNHNLIYGKCSMTAFKGPATALTPGGKRVKWLRN